MNDATMTLTEQQILDVLTVPNLHPEVRRELEVVLERMTPPLLKAIQKS